MIADKDKEIVDLKLVISDSKNSKRLSLGLHTGTGITIIKSEITLVNTVSIGINFRIW